MTAHVQELASTFSRALVFQCRLACSMSCLRHTFSKQLLAIRLCACHNIVQDLCPVILRCLDPEGGYVPCIAHNCLCSNLSADLQHLRKLLHEEKEASAAADGLLDGSQPHLLPGTHIPLEAATKEQVLQQLTIVLSKHATERARNGELVRRLQQLHAEKVDVLELQRQYLELQEAHFQQVCGLCSVVQHCL